MAPPGVGVVVTAPLATHPTHPVVGHPSEDRSEAVGRVSNAVAAGRPGAAPLRRLEQSLDFVEILAHRVVEFAEEFSLDERFDEHDGLAVDVVLRQHVDSIGSVAGLDEVPALPKVDPGWNLAEHVQIAVQGGDGLSDVQGLRGAENHGVQVRLPEQLVVVRVGRLGSVSVAGPLGAVLVEVTHRVEGSGHRVRNRLLEAPAPPAGADDSQSDRVVVWHRQPGITPGA